MASLAEYIPHSDRVHERVLRWTRRLSNYKNETNARCARAGILKVRKSTFAVLLTLPQGLRFAAGEVDDGCNSYFGQLTLSCVFSLCLIKLQRCSQPCWPPFYSPTSAEAPCLVPLNLNPYCNCKLYLTVGWFLAQDLQPHLYLTGSLLFFIYLLFFSCLPAFGSPTPTDFFSTQTHPDSHPIIKATKNLVRMWYSTMPTTRLGVELQCFQRKAHKLHQSGVGFCSWCLLKQDHTSSFMTPGD